ncbi:MAG TPA: acyl-CoA dehydratase activase, partial [Syntrophorhabdaceae bacterium]|nr:acyl-CoA dehydratase activase [Syntrophorhabdaceae bacterium]
MRSSGIDIGSRTVKLAVLEDGEIVLSRKAPVTHDPLEAVCRLIEDVDLGVITATGYGRHLVRKRLNSSVISEIKAFALGARKFSLDCRTILDIGGQDTKVIALDEKGDMSTFEMNDKCAAGTGRFLEIMAVALGYNLEEFSTAALSAGNAARINSTCAVFAESEVISLTYQGTPREEVALGIHKAIISRCSSMLKRIVAPGPILLAGGVALNECVRVLIGKEM